MVSLREALRDPALAILATVAAITFLYSAALALWTPPNSWDALWYHLARAAFWKQQHGIGYVHNADQQDVVLNAHAPGAEIGDLYTMVVASGDRFVASIELCAYAAATLSVFGLARRLLLDVRAALFAALIFATLPGVMLQASGALIDLVIGAFLAACLYFVLGARVAETGLAGLALALALETKLTAVLALPIVVLVLLVARPAPLVRLAITGLTALALGSGWYVLNVVETGSADGHLADEFDQIPEHGIAATAGRTLRLLVDFAEAPGAAGWWAACYAVSAGLAAALALREARRSSAVRLGTVCAVGLAGLAPLAVIGLGSFANRGYRWLFFHLGRPDLGILDLERNVTGASPFVSFFGPIGLFLVASILAVPFLVARRGLPRVAVVFAGSPIVFAVALAAAVAYEPWWGRFFVFAVALAAAVAGAFVGDRWLAWGAVAVAVVTVGLSLRANEEKPLAVWGDQRWETQTRVGPRNGEEQAIRFVEESVPRRARIGLAFRLVDWSYPFFGAHLERAIRFVPGERSPEPDLDWLVVAPTRTPPAVGWSQALRTGDGWRVLRRG